MKKAVIDAVVDLRWLWLLGAIVVFALSLKNSGAYQRAQAIEKEAGRKGLFGEEAYSFMLTKMCHDTWASLRAVDWLDAIVATTLLILFGASFFLR